MRTPANQTVEGNGQSLRFVAVPHLIVGRRSVHVHSEAVHVLVHETGMLLDHGGVREEGIVYGNENVNVNDEDTGQPDT
jgi:hypothetical protein